MRDSFDRRIRYLRVSVTDRCNLRCEYCAPRNGTRQSLGTESLLPMPDIARIVRAAVGLGVDKVRLTGGEPLVRPGIVGLVEELARIRGLSTLCMTTNGILLAPLARDLERAGLGSLNVSLDTVDPERYALITGGGSLDAALAGIGAALSAGIPVKINIVVDEAGLGADAESAERRAAREVERYASRIGASTQRIRRYDLAARKLDDPRFDRPPPCGGCDRIRLLADGRLKPCLHSDIAVPVDMDDIEGSLLRCAGLKPERGGVCTTLAVGQIGG